MQLILPACEQDVQEWANFHEFFLEIHAMKITATLLLHYVHIYT